jgi:hypothetical protein
MQSRKTSVEYTGSWNRVTPWLPWMLMGPTEGHAMYNTVMGAFDDINMIDRRTLDYIQKNDPKYLTAPDVWTEPSLSSLEWYSREQKPAPVPARRGVPRARRAAVAGMVPRLGRAGRAAWSCSPQANQAKAADSGEARRQAAGRREAATR